MHELGVSISMVLIGNRLAELNVKVEMSFLG